MRFSWIAAVLIAVTGPAFAADKRAEIISIKGKGEYRAQKDLQWGAAKLKQPLFPADFVRTGRDSRMDIHYDKEGVTQVIDHDTEMQVKDPATAQASKCTVELMKGRSFSTARAVPEGYSQCSRSATAAIRGTEWEMVVEDDGTTTLSVFHGEVRFYNEQGEVSVGGGEQARAQVGRAPVKLQLRVTRDRIQWVTSFTVDPGRYAEFAKGAPADLEPVARALDAGDLGQAYESLRRLAPRPGAPAVAFLLLADFETYRGDLAAAARVAEQGEARFPADERFEVSRARTALYLGDIAAARAHADAALKLRPASADALVVKGDIERREGRADEAVELYSRAIAAAPADARPWHGRGVVATEREDVRAARADLLRAIALDAKDPTYVAELGTLEGVADDLKAARARLEAALAMQPDNYVALTGLGIVQLKSGDAEGAILSFQKASAIEPRYARAHLYAAAAYYQQRHDRDAIAELERAGELDPNDPLPHLLMGMIHLDRIEPGEAAADARAALSRVGFVKSLNAVADNQKGIANFGAPLAFMGLEEWARSTAQDSYLPFWGGSHFFLSDRYAGDFSRRSELMQGFVTDPLAFGASNRFVTLFPDPGVHATASMRYSRSDDLHVIEPSLTVNGYDASRFPIAYLAEAIDTRVDPGNSDISIRARSYTAALGMRPMHELSTFLFANRFEIGADLGRQGVPGAFQRIDGTVSRVDAGVRYAPSATSSLWLKAGGSEQRSSLDETDRVSGQGVTLVSNSHFTLDPRASDVALRHTFDLPGEIEIDWGAEGARVRQPTFLGRDSTFHFIDATVPPESLAQSARDRSAGLYAVARITRGSLHAEAGAGWRDYRKDRGLDFIIGGAPSHLDESIQRRKAEPLAGLTWHAAADTTLRLACRRWLRPAAIETLAPVAVAGMPLDDQLVFAGGLLDQCRAQWEWTPGNRTFISARAERSHAKNLFSPLDGVQNATADISNLERLRNRVLTPPPIPDLLEDSPVFAEGVVKRANLAFERIVTPRLAARAYYTYADGRNEGPLAPGRKIPYIARHQANVGATWAPGWRTFLTLQVVYRTRRFADEANTVPLAAGWDAQARLFVETSDKRWAVEAFAANLLKKEASDVFGVAVSYRY